MRRKPRFLNQLEKRRLRRLGLLPIKRKYTDEGLTPERVMGVSITPPKLDIKVKIKDERKGTEELLKEEFDPPDIPKVGGSLGIKPKPVKTHIMIPEGEEEAVDE